MTTTKLTGKNVSIGRPFEIPPGLFPAGLNVPLPIEDSTPVQYAEIIGETHRSFTKYDHRKNGGHYQTPASIAGFMAECFPYGGPYLRVLDPGSGTGILSAAVCEAAFGSGTVQSLHVDAYETDPMLVNLTHLVLAFSREWLVQRGVALTFDVKHEDFVLENAATLETTSKINGPGRSLTRLRPEYDLVISNPPYFKIGKHDPRAVVGASVVHGQPNIYALFMAISAELLSESGRLVYIVPRSFASGPYFRRFREVFFRRVVPTAIHLFESRRDVFKSQTVLQENLVITARRRMEGKALTEGQVLVSHSNAAHDLADRQGLMAPLDSVLDLSSAHKVLCIPVCEADLELVQVVRSWPNTLHSLGLDISTGPVVPFRATRFLVRGGGPDTVPLLWMHHVLPMRIEWPSTGNDKPQWIRDTPESSRLLVEDGTYVLLRRFSAKEEKRRLVAAPMVQGRLNAGMVGLENHLNYIRGVSRELDRELAQGLAALLSSTFLDRYFRLSNGNTQVSATELRIMPLPAEQDIRAIGGQIHAGLDSGTGLPEIDVLVARTLNLSAGLLAG